MTTESEQGRSSNSVAEEPRSISRLGAGQSEENLLPRPDRSGGRLSQLWLRIPKSQAEQCFENDSDCDEATRSSHVVAMDFILHKPGDRIPVHAYPPEAVWFE